MTPLMLTLLIFAVMLVLMAVRTPIAIAMFAAGTVGYVLQAGWMPLASFLNTQAFARFASYDLSVIPLFILMGNFATQGGISRALFEFAAAVMGRFKGGLAMASVLACAAFGAICGSSVATAHGVEAIAADCGGCLQCATCHVIVDADWAARLPPPAPDELAMLEMTAAPRQPTSRLCCQITLTPSLDGLRVRLPTTQY